VDTVAIPEDATFTQAMKLMAERRGWRVQ